MKDAPWCKNSRQTSLEVHKKDTSGVNFFFFFLQSSHFLPLKKLWHFSLPVLVFLLFLANLFTSPRNVNLMYLSLQIKLSNQAKDSKDRSEILLFSLIFSDIIFLDLSLTDQKILTFS